MAVLIQEIINADYAFVIHTTNPSSGDDSEIYAEVIYVTSLFHLNFLVYASSKMSRFRDWYKVTSVYSRTACTMPRISLLSLMHRDGW